MQGVQLVPIWKRREELLSAPFIREIRTEDAEAAAQLSTELGYPVTTAAMAQRIRRRAEMGGRAVFVALVDDVVAGWVDVGTTDHLQNEPYGEIGGLVVSEAYRSAGVGAALVLRAEQWIREQGLARVTVRSQIKRERAHRFYLRQGYERVKTSAVFSKVLA